MAHVASAAMTRSEILSSPEETPSSAQHVRRHLPPAAASSKAAAEDLLFSALALALWCITSAKSALASPLLAHHNLQSLAGAAASERGPAAVGGSRAR